MKFVKHPSFIVVCRIMLGIIFIFASVDKIFMPGLFARAVYNYQLMPDFVINFWALWLPAIELVVGLFLIVGLFTRSSAILVIGLLFIFMGAMGVNIVRGIDIDCGCFGATGDDGPTLLYLLMESGGLTGSFLRDFLYLGLAIPILLVKEQCCSLDNWLDSRKK